MVADTVAAQHILTLRTAADAKAQVAAWKAAKKDADEAKKAAEEAKKEAVK